MESFYFFHIYSLTDLWFWLYQNQNYDYLEEPKVHHVHADLKRPTFAQEIYQFRQS